MQYYAVLTPNPMVLAAKNVRGLFMMVAKALFLIIASASKLKRKRKEEREESREKREKEGRKEKKVRKRKKKEKGEEGSNMMQKKGRGRERMGEKRDEVE
jgi:hypothetical protein